MADDLLLELDLSAGVVVEPSTDLVSRLQGTRAPSLPGVLRALEQARDDRRVRGLVVVLGGPAGLATAQELRGAVAAFAASGRPVTGWADTFGEFGPGTAGYLIGTACSELWLQASGDVGLTGAAVEGLFLREALERVGIEPQLAKRHEYKNAADLFLARGFSDAHREAAARLAGSVVEQVTAAVGAARGMSRERVRELVDAAPVAAADAVAAGLVDRLGYRDEAYAAARGRAGGPVELRYLSRYRRHVPVPVRPVRAARDRTAARVALVSAAGAIRRGRSGRTVGGGTAIGSGTLGAALLATTRQDRVRAVVLRIDSPGGSYVASDAIWRAVRAVRDSGRPVVVSMGDAAASGGYFAACGADAIVAQPGTLTGSIGVFGGKASVAGLLDRLGVGTDAVTVGRHARMFSPRAPFDPEQWAALEAWLDRVYDDFVGKVAAGRGMDRDRVHELARGRVWTGADAAERGLVDTLGGLDAAAAIARQRAGLRPDAPLRRAAPVPLTRRLRPADSSESPGALAGGGFAGGLVGPLLGVAGGGWTGSLAGVADRAGLLAEGPLLMPPITLR